MNSLLVVYLPDLTHLITFYHVSYFDNKINSCLVLADDDNQSCTELRSENNFYIPERSDSDETAPC